LQQTKLATRVFERMLNLAHCIVWHSVHKQSINVVVHLLHLIASVDGPGKYLKTKPLIAVVTVNR